MDYDKVPIVIVSHKRPKNVTTTKHITGCKICIPKSQEAEYMEYNPDIELITHPDEIIGLSPKRQWIYEKFKDVFMIDDDCTGVNRVYVDGKDKNYKIAPDIAEMWVNDIYHIAKESGIKLFGFNRSPNPMVYTGNKGFELTGAIEGGAFGCIWDERLYFPKDPYNIGEDTFISGLNAYYNRYLLIDLRISFAFEDTGVQPGGCADYRTRERRKQTYILMRKMFGDSVKHQWITPAKHKIEKWSYWLHTPF